VPLRQHSAVSRIRGQSRRSNGHGFLTGEIRSPEQLSDDDWRYSMMA
jgi:hypothetical protein